MTSFANPLIVRGKRLGEAAQNFAGGAVVVVPVRVTSGQFANTTAGATTVPLFIAPAGHRAIGGSLDFITPVAPTSGTWITVGWPAAPGALAASISCDIVKRTVLGPVTSAQMSAMSIPFATDTTIEMIVSVSGTAARTAGEFMLYIEVVADTSTVA